MSIDGGGEGVVGFLRGRDGEDAIALNADGLVVEFGAGGDVDDGCMDDSAGCGRMVLGERGATELEEVASQNLE